MTRTFRQGSSGTIIVDAGDNSAVDTSVGVKPRLQLRAGESCSSAIVSVAVKPSTATSGAIGSGSSIELGTPAAVSANTECNDRIVETGEGITIQYALATAAPAGRYRLHVAITTSASRIITKDLDIIVEAC